MEVGRATGLARLRFLFTGRVGLEFRWRCCVTVHRIYNSDWFVDWLKLSVVRAEDDLIGRVASVQVCGAVELSDFDELLADVWLLCRPSFLGTLLHILLSRVLLFGSPHCCCIVSG